MNLTISEIGTANQPAKKHFEIENLGAWNIFAAYEGVNSVAKDVVEGTTCNTVSEVNNYSESAIAFVRYCLNCRTVSYID